MRKSKTKKSENGTSFTEEDDQPLASVATPSEDYEVESIVGMRKKRGQTEYKVHWKGYASDEDSWEAENNLNCQELIEAYLSTAGSGTAKKGKRGRPPTAGKLKGKKKKIDKNEEEEGEDGDAEEAEDDDKEYDVEKILDLQLKRNGERLFLIRWKGYSKKHDTWQAEDSLQCPDLIASFMKKVDKAKSATPRETRVNRKRTEHYRVPPPKTGRKHKRRSDGPRRTYNEDGD